MGAYLCKDAEHAKQAKKEDNENSMLPASEKSKKQEKDEAEVETENPDIPFADATADEDEGDEESKKETAGKVVTDYNQHSAESKHVIEESHHHHHVESPDPIPDVVKHIQEETVVVEVKTANESEIPHKDIKDEVTHDSTVEREEIQHTKDVHHDEQAKKVDKHITEEKDVEARENIQVIVIDKHEVHQDLSENEKDKHESHEDEHVMDVAHDKLSEETSNEISSDTKVENTEQLSEVHDTEIILDSIVNVSDDKETVNEDAKIQHDNVVEILNESEKESEDVQIDEHINEPVNEILDELIPSKNEDIEPESNVHDDVGGEQLVKEENVIEHQEITIQGSADETKEESEHINESPEIHVDDKMNHEFVVDTSEIISHVDENLEHEKESNKQNMEEHINESSDVHIDEKNDVPENTETDEEKELSVEKSDRLFQEPLDSDKGSEIETEELHEDVNEDHLEIKDSELLNQSHEEHPIVDEILASNEIITEKHESEFQESTKTEKEFDNQETCDVCENFEIQHQPESHTEDLNGLETEISNFEEFQMSTEPTEKDVVVDVTEDDQNQLKFTEENPSDELIVNDFHDEQIIASNDNSIVESVEEIIVETEESIKDNQEDSEEFEKPTPQNLNEQEIIEIESIAHHISSNGNFKSDSDDQSNDIEIENGIEDVKEEELIKMVSDAVDEIMGDAKSQVQHTIENSASRDTSSLEILES